MNNIKIEAADLKQLHTFLNNGEDHSDPMYSQAALNSIRGMEQPCPNTSRQDIRGIGACVGDNINSWEHLGSVTVSCDQAEGKGLGITCKVTGRKCDMCLPKPRKSGTAMIIIS
ncbi:MAG: hypothetical protein WC851_04175 [Candidatus Shapirobacteria bacterium]|jgi:hypothetical protein